MAKRGRLDGGAGQPGAGVVHHAAALITESAEQTTLLAADVGGDADSVASIGAAIAGALRLGTVNEDWFGVVQAVNGDDPVEMARALAILRG